MSRTFGPRIVRRLEGWGRLRALSLLVAIVSVLGLAAVPSTTRGGDAPPKPLDVVLVYEDFEGAFPGSWTVGDSDGASGLDYWDDTNYRAFAGSWSGWSAEIGWNDNWGNWNNVVHEYDDDMAAYMYIPIDLSGYAEGRIEYWYWVDAESCCDGLEVMYFDGGAWYYRDQHTGWGGSWQFSSWTFPATATGVGLNFFTDGSVIGEGAYVDEVQVWGVTPAVSCSTTVSPPVGLEGTTTFSFTASASGGSPPYAYVWTFDDGATSTAQNPTHAYASQGTYFPSVVVTDFFGAMCARATAAIVVGHAGPISVQVTPATASVDPGKTQTVTVRVTDVAGHDVTSLSTITWTVSKASCGAVTSATGASTTFRAADGGAGEQCQVTAAAVFSTWTGGGSASVTVTGMPLWMIGTILAIVVIVPLLLAALLLMKRRKRQGVVVPTTSTNQPMPAGPPYQQAPTMPGMQPMTGPPAGGAPGEVPTMPQAAPQPMPGYAGPPAQPSAPVCPRCGRPIQYVQQYARWYCPSEGTYL